MPVCFRSTWKWFVVGVALLLGITPGLAADRMVLGEYFTMLG